tara:strand:- start:236 stop:1354 length:1119 start_codon:yes stop_codon:yes gene_type:complete
MNSKSFVKNIFLFTILFLIFIALINYFIDPGNIYPKNSLQKNKITPKTYVDELVESENGLFLPKNTWNERDIKKAFAEYRMNYDCALIGSSHVMQISSNSQNRPLESICKSIKNLAVSGGTLEDFIALSNIITKNEESTPKTIVFGIDPWSLNFGRDRRWTRYEKDYFEMKDRLFSEDPILSLKDNGDLKKDLFLNLFNMHYLKQSLGWIFEEKVELLAPAPEFNHNVGLNLPVILPDGSLVYSAEYIENAKKKIKTISGKESYKIIKDSYYQDYAIEVFEKLIVYLIDSKINVVFVLTPYHHKVWSYSGQPIYKALNVVESKIHDIANQYKIKVIGSYDPVKTRCLESEFYDPSHASYECIAKLVNKTTVY